MIKIVELKETILDGNIYDDIHKIQDLTKLIIEELEIQDSINRDDYNYLEIIIEKTKKNLQKIYLLTKLQNAD